MTKKLLGCVCGLAMAAFVGSAWAGEPVELTSDQLDQVTAGAGGCLGFCFSKNVTGWTDIHSKIETWVKGGNAEATSDAVALGYNSASFTVTNAYTDHLGSASKSYAAAYRN